MYKRILAAVNEHVNAEAAARYALGVARETGAKLYLYHAAGRKALPEALGRASEAMKRLFERALAEGIEAEAVTETGSPVESISAFARRAGTDLVFAATRHEGAHTWLMRGSVSRRLMERLSCSVAVVRVIHLGHAKPREVLVPLKARIGSIEERACFTAMIAKASGARLVLFHASAPVEDFFHGEAHVTPAELEARLPLDIGKFAALTEQYGVGHDRRAISGHAGSTITIEAARKRSDLIVMGASERGFIGGLIGESPVEHVLRETPCDLIIFRPRHGH